MSSELEQVHLHQKFFYGAAVKNDGRGDYSNSQRTDTSSSSADRINDRITLGLRGEPGWGDGCFKLNERKKRKE